MLVLLKNLFFIWVVNKVNKFIFASSSSVYGGFSGAVKETDLLNPMGLYAQTKKIGEDFCKMFEDINTIVLRFFTVYGENGRPEMSVTKFIRKINSGLPIFVNGDGSAMRGYTYVKDVCDGIIESMKLDLRMIRLMEK